MVGNRISRTEEVEAVLLSKLHELARPDGRLPTEAEIAQMFSVSRTTVRSAVGALVARGLVIRRQGTGSFVSQASRIANPLDEAIDFSEVIRRNLCCPTIRYVSATLVSLDEASATLLNQSDRMALRRHTLFSADNDPVIYCINTIPLWVLPGNLADEVLANPAISEPIYNFLALRCNQRVELSRATVWPDLARNCDMAEAIVDPLTPVLVIEEVGYNTSGQPMLHSLEYYPGRSMRFELVRRRSPGP
jgi:DNA-binding GntR family transcriptional regulator